MSERVHDDRNCQPARLGRLRVSLERSLVAQVRVGAFRDQRPVALSAFGVIAEVRGKNGIGRCRESLQALDRGSERRDLVGAQRHWPWASAPNSNRFSTLVVAFALRLPAFAPSPPKAGSPST